jgi:Domain of unknown function (DUF5615)
METAIRFHLDENIDHAVAHARRNRGIDVTTTTDADLISAADEDHLAFAVAERRIIVTHDPDFLRLHDAGHEHAGIVFCVRDRTSIGEMTRFLSLVHDVLTPDEISGQIEYL